MAYEVYFVSPTWHRSIPFVPSPDCFQPVRVRFLFPSLKPGLSTTKCVWAPLVSISVSTPTLWSHQSLTSWNCKSCQNEFEEEWYLWSYTLEHFSCLVSHKDTSTCWKCSMCWSSCLQCCVLFQQASSVQWCCSCVVLCMVERLKHKHLWGLCGLHPVLVFWVCWLSLPAKLQRFTQPAIPQGSAKWEPQCMSSWYLLIHCACFVYFHKF